MFFVVFAIELGKNFNFSRFELSDLNTKVTINNITAVGYREKLVEFEYI